MVPVWWIGTGGRHGRGGSVRFAEKDGRRERPMNSRDEHMFRFGHKDLCILMEGVIFFFLVEYHIPFFEHTITFFEFALDDSDLILLVPLFWNLLR